MHALSAVATAVVALVLLSAGASALPAAPTTEPAAPTTEPAAPTTEPATPTIELQSIDAARPLQVARRDLEHHDCIDGIGCSDERSYRIALTQAMQKDPEYGAARAKRVSGIIVLSVAGGGTVLMGFMSLLAAAYESWDFSFHYNDQPTVEENHLARNLGIAALCSLGVALTVGLPLLISGISDTREIRRRTRRRLATSGGLQLASGPGQMGLGLRFRF
jgi:hypothetical protein